MQVDFGRLCRYHESGKIRHSVSTDRPDLHVWCYSQSTVFNRDWDDLTRLCRGLVTDGEGNVISRPFPKFHNWGEPEAPGPEVTVHPFTAYDKEDGTLIIVGTDSDGEAVVSTKGSFDTWHSEAAREMLGDWKPIPGATVMFEFIHPDNRIVVDYHGRKDLVLLGAVWNDDGLDHFKPEDVADEMGWHGAVATPRKFHLPTMLQTIQDPEAGENREGFVLVWPNPEGPSHRVKIKFSQYVNLHRILSRISNVSIWEALKDRTFETLLDLVPDEIYDDVRETANELIQEFQRGAAYVVSKEAAVRMLHDNRKDQAIWIKENVESEYQSAVFKMLDGKEDAVRSNVWDLVKPVRDEAWTFLK